LRPRAERLGASAANAPRFGLVGAPRTGPPQPPPASPAASALARRDGGPRVGVVRRRGARLWVVAERRRRRGGGPAVGKPRLVRTTARGPHTARHNGGDDRERDCSDPRVSRQSRRPFDLSRMQGRRLRFQIIEYFTEAAKKSASKHGLQHNFERRRLFPGIQAGCNLLNAERMYCSLACQYKLFIFQPASSRTTSQLAWRIGRQCRPSWVRRAPPSVAPSTRRLRWRSR